MFVTIQFQGKMAGIAQDAVRLSPIENGYLAAPHRPHDGLQPSAIGVF